MLKTTTYCLPGVSEFESSNLDSSAVAIITRPPEIFACLKLRLTPQNVFTIFDSHPRPSYPNDAGMTVNTSIEGTARRLTELFPTVDLKDSFLQWRAELLANYSGHVFVPHGVETSTPTFWQVVFESSLAQLWMQAEISELRSQNEFPKNEQQRLESEIKEAEARSRRQETLIQQQQQFRSSSSPPKYFDRPSAPPGHSSLPTRHPSCPSSSKASISTSNPFGPDSPSTTKSSSGRAPGLHQGTLATHLLHPLIAMMTFFMRCACSTNLITKTGVRSPHSALSLPSPPNDCSCAAYVWTRCPMIQLLVPILVDIPSVTNACADTLARALMNIDSLYCAPLVLQIKARERR
jgi:hypothetical protein